MTSSTHGAESKRQEAQVQQSGSVVLGFLTEDLVSLERSIGNSSATGGGGLAGFAYFGGGNRGRRGGLQLIMS
jgi:hypothetical protein